jgi:glycosyltransferase involved in cell wall biosynthesis
LETLSIIIPAYNEEKRLSATLDRVLAYLSQCAMNNSEVIVVDDGSVDGTASLVRRYQEDNPVVRLLQNPGNRGKGYAVRHGMTEGRGDWLLISDADLSAPIEEVEKLREAAQREKAAVAIGSRAVDRSKIEVHQPLFREISGRAFNAMMRALTGLPFRDTQCGFKLFRQDAARDIFPRQQLDGFSFDVEDLVIAKARGHRVVEVPVRWSNVEGTRVSLRHGMKSFSDLMVIRRHLRDGKYT